MHLAVTERTLLEEGAASTLRTLEARAVSLGLELVAEGVETPQQLEPVVAVGCSRVQGFLLGRPEPLPD